MSYKSYKQSGLGMVEMIIVISVIVVAFTAILQLLKLEAQTERVRREETKAYALMAEGLEAIRAVRDDAWSNISALTPGADYYVDASSGAWEITSADPGPIDGYSRWIVFSSVKRDVNYDISDTGTVDEDTIKVISYAEWQSRGSVKTRSITAYLTNWQEKL